MPGCHHRPMSYLIRRKDHLCSLEESSRLLNSQVGTEQPVMRVNLLPHTYGLKGSTAHNTAITSRSVGDLLAWVRDRR